MQILNKIKRELNESRPFLQFGLLNGVGQVLGMIAPLIIARFLSPELFGNYSLAKIIIFFFLTIFIAGIQTPFIVLANQERIDSGKINKSFSIQCLFIVTGVCVFMTVAVLLSGSLASFSGINVGDVVFVCLAFIGFAIESFLATLFMAMGQRMKNALVELVFGALTVGFVFVFYWAGAISIKNVFLVHFISSITVVLIFVWVVDFDKLRPFTIDRKYFRDMFDFAKWLIFGSMAVFFVNWGDSFVLRIFNKSFGDIGTYNLGYGIFKGVCALILIINTYFLPFVSENIGDGTRIREYLNRKRPRILLFGVLMIGLLFIISPYFLKVVYRDAYQDSAAVLRLLLIGCLLMLYSVFYDPIFHATKRYKFTQTLNMAQAIVNLVVDFLLVPSMGLMGTAVGAVCGYFCRAVTMEIYFNTRLKKILKM